MSNLRVLFASCNGAHVHKTAAEVLKEGHATWLYTSTKNSTGLPAANYRRCWPFHIACKPFYHTANGRYSERAFHWFFHIWNMWLKRQPLPDCDVVHAVMASAMTAFDHADRIGALKVLDASNSHPTSFYGFWQQELDIWNPGLKIPLPRRVFRRANQEIDRADVILCPSNYVRDSMLYNNVPESKLSVLPYGADLRVFTPRQRPPNTPRFLFVGLLTLRKGVQYLVPAFERLKRQVPGAELILCGMLYSDFRKLFQQWKHLFTYIPGLQHDKLAELMHSTTAFVFPSIEEGFARVITEAMAGGLPIIATHNSGATTVVENGKQGIIVPARSSQAVTAAMLQMIEQPDLCDSMGKAAAARMALSGSWSHYARQLVEIYNLHLSKR